jgi:hypothetical protein
LTAEGAQPEIAIAARASIAAMILVKVLFRIKDSFLFGSKNGLEIFPFLLPARENIAHG